MPQHLLRKRQRFQRRLIGKFGYPRARLLYGFALLLRRHFLRRLPRPSLMRDRMCLFAPNNLSQPHRLDERLDDTALFIIEGILRPFVRTHDPCQLRHERQTILLMRQQLGALIDPLQGPKRRLRSALNINPPAGKFGRQTRILPGAANGKRELIIQHHHRSRLAAGIVFIEHHTQHRTDAQRAGDVLLRLLEPLDHINALIIELAGDRLNADATHPHTRPHRIHPWLARRHRDFGARAGLAGDTLDFDQAAANFGHFQLQEPAQHRGVAARNCDLRAACGPFDIHDVDANLLVQAITLAGNLFPTRHLRLFLVFQVQGNALRIDRLNRTDDDLVDLAAKAGELALPISLAQALGNHLLGGLRGDTAKVVGGDIHHQQLSQLHTAVDAPGISQRDFEVAIFDGFDHYLFQEDPRQPRVHVDLGGEILRWADLPIPPISGNQSRPYRFQDRVPR